MLPANNNNAPVALPETPVIVKPAEGLIDEACGVDADTSDNGIADYKGGGPGGGNQGKPVEQPEAATSITAEYWVTNARVTADSETSKNISSNNSEIVGAGENGVAVETLAPETGTQGNNNVIFWQARVLSGEDKQTDGGGVDSTSKGKEIQSIRYCNSEFSYQEKGNTQWTEFTITNGKVQEQLVFYYMIKADFEQNVSVAITDWPNTNENQIPSGAPSPHQVNYEVWKLEDEEAELNTAQKLGETVPTYYNSALTISAIKVSMNENEQYYIQSIKISDTKNGSYAEPTVTSSQAEFALDLSTAGNSPILTNNAVITIKIYVTAYKYELAYEKNGGTISGSGYTVAGFYRPNSEINAPTSANITKQGYTFVGWYKDREYTDENKWTTDSTMPSEKLTLYAKWDENNYTVNYNLNYEGAQNPTDRNNVHWNDANLLPSGSFTREGYIFDGWYTQSTAGKNVTDAMTYASIAENDTDTSVTLYAHWNQDSKPTTESTPVYVYFKIVDAAGNNIKDKSKINNDDLKNTACNNDADKKTWATLGKIALTGDITEGTLTNAGDAAQVQLKNANNLYSKNKDIAQTVLANVQWFQLKQWAGATDYVPDGSRWHLDGKITGYTVTYNNGTTEATDDVHNMPGADKMYYLSGSEYTVSNATPTRTGYTFAGWKSSEGGTVYKTEGNMQFAMPNKDVTLTAQWEKIYTVTFNAGDNGKLDQSQDTVTKTGKSGMALTAPTPKANEGFEFVGWVKGSDTTTVEIPATITENATYTATWQEKQNPTHDTVNYTINKHFKDNEGKTKDVNGTLTQGIKNVTLGNLIKIDAVNQTDENGNNYVYISDETTFKMGGHKVTSNTQLTSEATIDLYYYLDNWKDADEAGKDSATGGDGIPDCDQVLIKYVSSNSDRGTVSPDMEVLTIRGSDKQPTNKGTVTASGSTATVTGSSRNYFSNWTNNAGLATSSTAKLGQQTFTTEGGKTYTFTANFGYSGGGGSGGSSRPSTPPTVDIPDNDVPTGLNGKDHYAYIIGYGNNDVRPQNNITRAEVATIFFRLLTDETREANMTKSNSYNDVKDGDWFCCAVSTLSKMGIIKGYEDGSFKPNDPISRAEFAAIAARFDPDGDKTPASFSDVTSHWAKDEISIAANHGWIKGYEDGSFKPDQKITRAETMTLVNRVLNRLPEAKDDLHKDMKTWVDNMDETAWYYLAVQEATNSHYFKNKTSTKFEQWTELRDTRDWSELEK